MSYIVIDARILNSSTGTYAERLLHYLQEVDTTNTYSVLVPEKDKDYWKPTNENFKVVTIPFENYSFNEQLGYKRFLDTLAPDLVHFLMPQQPIFYKGAHVTTFHDLILLKVYNSDKNWFIFHAKQFIGKFTFKQVAKRSNHIIVPSEYTKKELLAFSHVPANKITVTYESADINKTVGALEQYKHPYKHYLLYVGKQSDYKNIRRLASAHQRLMKKYPDLGLILVGKKDNAIKANEVYFASKKYSNILFTDYLPNAQRDWLYTNAAAYVFPSLIEGFGLPGLEAMGYGVPVISSNATCLPEIYEAAAHYFNPNDTTDIARAIDEVLSSPVLASEMVKMGYEQLKKYSWLTMTEHTHAIYMDAIKLKN